MTAFVWMLIPAAISSAQTAGGKSEKPELLAAVAANAVPAVEEIARRFTGETGVRVTLSAGSSGALARQAREGAPFDLFISADMERLEQLARDGTVETSSVAAYARGVLVLWQPTGAAPRLKSLDELSSPAATRMRIALPNPVHAPYGMAAKAALERIGLWSRLNERIVYGEDVGQVFQIARTGNVDAAFLPLSLVRDGTAGSWIGVPAELHPPINQGLGILTRSAGSRAAQQFRDYMLASRGQEILRKHGYLSPSAP